MAYRYLRGNSKHVQKQRDTTLTPRGRQPGLTANLVFFRHLAHSLPTLASGEGPQVRLACVAIETLTLSSQILCSWFCCTRFSRALTSSAPIGTAQPLGGLHPLAQIFQQPWAPVKANPEATEAL